MVTSLYMPDVEVHIAFDSGYTTPAASRTWTDVSDYVELADRISIAFGRQDERSSAGANTLTLTLDNTDGRFTAGRAASPYYPNVKIGRPIRVRVTPPGGTTSTRFVGFVDEWPVEWDGTDAYAKARIRATSRLARLGLNAQLRSIPESEILATGPIGYWTLGDPSGATSGSESSGNPDAGPMLPHEPGQEGDGAPVVFGSATGVGVDGLTAAQFVGTDGGGVFAEDLRADLPMAAGPRSVRACFRLDSLPALGADVAMTLFCGISVTAAGLVSGTVTTGPSINDGLTHDVVVTRDGTNERLYLDGALVDTTAAGNASAWSYVSVGTLFPGAISHVAVYDRALTGTEIAQQSQSVRLGNAGDLTSVRVGRLLDWAGVATSEATLETGVERMTYQLTSGMSVVDALRECESTEGGVLFDGRDGNVQFHNRAHRYQATAAATLDMAEQQVEAGYAPKLDRSALVNDATAENPTTGETARSVDTTSSDEYGPATASARVVADTYDPLQQAASWLVASYAQPRVRVPSLTVDVLAQQGVVNYVTNPSFTVNTTGWTFAAGTLTRISEGADFVGDYVSSTSAGGNYISTNYMPAEPGLAVTGAIDLKMQGVASNYQVILLWYNGAAFLSSTTATYSSGSLSGVTYTRISVSGTAPANTTQVRMQVQPTGTLAVGAGFRVDRAQLGEPVSYFDGDSSVTNVIPNPSFETDTSGWNSQNGTFSRVGSSGSGVYGSYVGAFVATSTAGSQFISHNVASAVEGEDYTGSIWLKMQGVAANYNFQILWYTGAVFLSASSVPYQASALSGTEFRRLTITRTAPTGADGVRIQVSPTSPVAVGAGFQVDGAMITQTSAALDYFEGTRSTAEWSGTPSASTSVLASPSAQTLLGVTVGDLLAVTNAPRQNDTTNPSYFVEGYTETIGPQSYEISFNLSPTYPTLNTVVLDHATRAELDAGNVIAF